MWVQRQPSLGLPNFYNDLDRLGLASIFLHVDVEHDEDGVDDCVHSDGNLPSTFTAPDLLMETILLMMLMLMMVRMVWMIVFIVARQAPSQRLICSWKRY